MFFRTAEIFGQVCLNSAFLNTTVHSGNVFKGRSRLADYFCIRINLRIFNDQSKGTSHKVQLAVIFA